MQHITIRSSVLTIFFGLAWGSSALAQKAAPVMPVEAVATANSAASPTAPSRAAAVDVPVEIGSLIASHATFVLELGSPPPFIETIIPVQPTPATVIAPGTRLVLRVAAEFGAVTQVNWYRDTTLIATDTPELTLSATINDSGYYRASFSGNPDFGGTDSVQLQVATADSPRIVNQSTRVTLSPSSPAATFGFVIDPRVAPSFFPIQRVLIRVIGPGLETFSVPHPVADPVYRLHNAAGTDITPGEVFATDIIDSKTAAEKYRDEVNTQTARVGAFPVETDLQSAPEPRSLADVTTLFPGAYTMTVSSKSGATGEVVVEIYEIPLTEPSAGP